MDPAAITTIIVSPIALEAANIIAAALSGTILFMSIVIPVSFIFGVGTALYLEQYAKESIFKKIIEINNQTLAGVPSVVFGLLGLTIFVYALPYDLMFLSTLIE